VPSSRVRVCLSTNPRPCATPCRRQLPFPLFLHCHKAAQQDREVASVCWQQIFMIPHNAIGLYRQSVFDLGDHMSPGLSSCGACSAVLDSLYWKCPHLGPRCCRTHRCPFAIDCAWLRPRQAFCWCSRGLLGQKHRAPRPACFLLPCCWPCSDPWTATKIQSNAAQKPHRCHSQHLCYGSPPTTDLYF